MNTPTSLHDQDSIALTVQLPAKVVDTLHDIVTAKKGFDINTLVASYIEKGVEHDLPEARRKCFFSHVKAILEKHNVPEEAIAEIDDKFTY